MVYRIASQLQSASTALNGEVLGLRETWTGTASNSYQAGWDELQTGATGVWDALFELAAKLGVTAATFTETDGAFASNISSLDLP